MPVLIGLIVTAVVAIIGFFSSMDQIETGNK